ncbi:MAG: pseudouridine synthase [Thiohalocapsa sp.]|nr:pseudouridine synthase [Thiohalocapsa sp.]MCF7990342.1 pseudouridine synthase [Thiohalocapsa sp.]
MSRLILFNKPYGVPSQFSGEEPTLAAHIPLAGFYPAGRLDKDSEGLLLLTDDGRLQHHIAHPAHKQWKTYWVQVEGVPEEDTLAQLRAGVVLKDGPTKPARARRIADPALWARNPPVRYRKTVPDSWLEIAIREGRNRQIRRMTAAVGLPTLRLVRIAVGEWELGALSPGAYRLIETPPPPSAPRRSGMPAVRKGSALTKRKSGKQRR